MWRRWLAVIAVAATLVAGLWWLETAYPPLRHSYEYHQANDTGHKHNPGDDLVRILGVGLWSLVDAIERHHDLWLVLETLALVGFTGTLWWSTRKLWQSSLEHAGHAEQAIKVAERSAERQLRAYVMPDADMELRVSVGGQLSIHFTIKNFGHTPARDVTQWTAVSVIAPQDLAEIGTEPTDTTGLSRFIVPPNGTASVDLVSTEILTPSEIHEITTGNLEFYIWGKIEYKDAFGEPRFTKYRLRSVGNDFARRRVGYTQIGNDYS